MSWLSILMSISLQIIFMAFSSWSSLSRGCTSSSFIKDQSKQLMELNCSTRVVERRRKFLLKISINLFNAPCSSYSYETSLLWALMTYTKKKILRIRIVKNPVYGAIFRYTTLKILLCSILNENKCLRAPRCSTSTEAR